MTTIQLRRSSAAAWASADPVLAVGEVGLETDTLKFKAGNGSSLWSELPYYSIPSWGEVTGKPVVIAAGATKADARSAIDAASLDSNGRVPVAQLPASLMQYQGVWDADTNTPSLVDGTGDTGDVYRITVAGTRNLGSGSTEFAVGDYVIYNSAGVWEKSDTTDAVATVAGRTGNVVLAAADVSGVASLTGSETLSGKTLTNPTISSYVESVVAIGTVGAANTLSLVNGTVLTATLTASTATTFTMPALVAGKSFALLLRQAATTGNGTATFTNVKWTGTAPVVTATAGRMDIFSFFSDGTNWYGSVAAGYTP